MPFYLVALMLAIAAIAAKGLISVNIRLYTAAGLLRFAGFWEAQMRWLLPCTRVLCLTGSLVFLGLGIGIL